ncbi:unnamed protein product [Hyaloperonospora brassicae]|uniref:RxLR effector candidate protein n=1 Tax=Hyaloperonospora brassicae TaxID=162125 RepID=A0AAV0URY3_HYABA|nr:unnamed protein product [Hyaloperonospora brassicae]
MAAIVPISCNQRWRSRSRNASTDSDFLGLIPAPLPTDNMLQEADASESEDEDDSIEQVESSHNIVIPREFTAHEAAWSIPPRIKNAKSMERRRASSS